MNALLQGGSGRTDMFDVIISEICWEVLSPAALCFLSHQRERSLWTGWRAREDDSFRGMMHQNQFVHY